nr:uncharacterized protein LOC124811229 [Hydra vulgaris]
MPLYKTASKLDEAHTLIKDHELEYTVRFSTSFSTKDFGNTDLKKKPHKIYWSTDSIEFSGIPFMMIGTKIFDCHHGYDRNLSRKEYNKQNRKALNIDHDCRRKYARIQNCKKFDCPAQLIITEYLEFPEYKLILDTVRNRRAKSKELRYAIML